MNFVKMQGLGNDFIMINNLQEEIKEEAYSQLAIQVCNRHFGIGGDGLMVVLPSEKAHIRMRIFNSDGSEPEMCGNGIRCFAKYVYEQGIVKEKIINVETLAGIIIPEIIQDDDGKVKAVRVDMGEPILNPQDIPITGIDQEKVVEEVLKVEDQTFNITAVSMGNPHCVIFVPDIEEIELSKWGPLIEKHNIFPRKTNVEFVQVVNPKEVIMRVWERGAGVTLACGTGACATLVAGVLTKRTEKQAFIKLTGGDLLIEWAENNHIYMTGPAVEVFRGEYYV